MISLPAHISGDVVLGLNVTRVCSEYVFYLKLCAHLKVETGRLFQGCVSTRYTDLGMK
jgi:hypothetical protein